jgi:hypothetical protein
MTAWRKAFLTLAIFGVLVGGIAPALGQTPTAGVAPHCRIPEELMDLRTPLPLTTARLAAGQPLVIVAVGSSSTAGAGASHPGASYPARLREELVRRFPGASIVMVNRGVNGETS